MNKKLVGPKEVVQWVENDRLWMSQQLGFDLMS